MVILRMIEVLFSNAMVILKIVKKYSKIRLQLEENPTLPKPSSRQALRHPEASREQNRKTEPTAVTPWTLQA